MSPPMQGGVASERPVAEVPLADVSVAFMIHAENQALISFIRESFRERLVLQTQEIQQRFPVHRFGDPSRSQCLEAAEPQPK